MLSFEPAVVPLGENASFTISGEFVFEEEPGGVLPKMNINSTSTGLEVICDDEETYDIKPVGKASTFSKVNYFYFVIDSNIV